VSVGQAPTGLLADIEIARAINSMHGFGVIAAWEVGQLDEATVGAMLTVRSEMASFATQATGIEAVKERIRGSVKRR